MTITPYMIEVEAWPLLTRQFSLRRSAEEYHAQLQAAGYRAEKRKFAEDADERA